MDFSIQVSNVLIEIKDLLIEKNLKYGNSALEPLGVFSQLSAKEGLLVRIDDKLKRIKNGTLDQDDEDVINDLIGYLVLLKIYANNQQSKYENLMNQVVPCNKSYNWQEIKEKQDLIKKMQQELRDDFL